MQHVFLNHAFLKALHQKPQTINKLGRLVVGQYNNYTIGLCTLDWLIFGR